METLIQRLLQCNNTDRLAAQAEMEALLEHPETIEQLCHHMESSPNLSTRQYSAILLTQRFKLLRCWQMLPTEMQQNIQRGLMAVVERERIKPVQNVIIKLMGTIGRHSCQTGDSWMLELIQIISAQCSSFDSEQSVLTSQIFSSLAETAGDLLAIHFFAYLTPIFNLFVQSGYTKNFANIPVLLNIVTGMSHLMPHIKSNRTARDIYQQAMPCIIEFLRNLLVEMKTDEFIQAFDALESVADNMPQLLNNHISQITEFCLRAADCVNLDDHVRIKTITYVDQLVYLKTRLITNNQMVEPIIRVAFNMIATMNEEAEDDNDPYGGSEDINSIIHVTTRVMNRLALNVSTDIVLPPTLALVEIAMSSQCSKLHRAAFYAIISVAQGCVDGITDQFFGRFVEFTKAGMNDSNPIIRNSAFFTLVHLTQHLQVKIFHYAAEIVPILLGFLEREFKQLKESGIEPKDMSVTFFAVTAYFENSRYAIVEHLEPLVNILFEILSMENLSSHLRSSVLGTLQMILRACIKDMLPHSSRIITVMCSFFEPTVNEGTIYLRSEAIDTIAILGRKSNQNFKPFTNDVMAFALKVLKEFDEPEIRCSLYNLFGCLALVLRTELEHVLPIIIPWINQSILSENGDVNGLNTMDIGTIGNINCNGNRKEAKTGCWVENVYIREKLQAIYVMKEFSEWTGACFIPYLETAFYQIFKLADHNNENIVATTIFTLCSFVLALHNHKNIQGASHALKILLKKMSQIIQVDEDIGVVQAVFKKYFYLLNLPNEIITPDVVEVIFTNTMSILQRRTACQLQEMSTYGDGEDDANEFQFDLELVQSAITILGRICQRMNDETFLSYFHQVLPLILQKSHNASNTENDKWQCAIMDCLSNCIESLNKFTGDFYHVLYPMLTEGLKNRRPCVRNIAAYGIGKLAFHCKEKTFHIYPDILNYILNDENNVAKDVVLTTIARLTITNHTIVPLPEIMAKFAMHLPLKHFVDDYTIVYTCLILIYLQARNVFEPHLENILSHSIRLLLHGGWRIKKQLIVDLVRKIRNDYAEKFNLVLTNMSNELATNLCCILDQRIQG